MVSFNSQLSALAFKKYDALSVSSHTAKFYIKSYKKYCPIYIL